MALDLRGQDVSWKDLRGENLAGAVLAHCKLDATWIGNCPRAKFVKATGCPTFAENADITGATFEEAATTVIERIKGTRWGGELITAVFPRFEAPVFHSYAFIAGASKWLSIGCMTRRIDEWHTVCNDIESISALKKESDDIDPAFCLKWWRHNSPQFMAWFDRYDEKGLLKS